MKKIVLALAIALMGTMVMNAQPPRRSNMSPEQMVERRVDRLDKALSLTEEQKAEITKIYSQEMESMGKDRPAKVERGQRPDEATMQARDEQMKAQREATEAKIEALLSPEQAAKYAELKNQEGKRGHKRDRHDAKHGNMDKNPKQDGCCNADGTCTCKKEN